MPKIRSLRTVGAAYLDTAPVRETLRQAIPASAAETFRSLEDAQSWPEWLDPIEAVTWTSPRPFGIGTTRDVRGKAGTISELFFDWDDGHRMSFHFTSASVPLFAAFCEDYELLPGGDDECELVWRYAFECRGVFKPIQPLVAKAFERVATKSLAQLAEFMRQYRGRYSAA